MSAQEIAQARENLNVAVGREMGHIYTVIGQPLPLTAAIEDLIRAYLVNHVEFAGHQITVSPLGAALGLVTEKDEQR